MEDDELQKIRAERLRQLKQQSGAGGGGGGDSAEQQAKQQRQQEARKDMLNQILEPDAADRLARIRLVKAERAAAVEDRLLSLAQSGQLRAKVSEDQLKDLLQRLSAAEDARHGSGSIVIERRPKGGFDDDDDLDF